MLKKYNKSINSVGKNVLSSFIYIYHVGTKTVSFLVQQIEKQSLAINF